jgi:hypothetical protein
VIKPRETAGAALFTLLQNATGITNTARKLMASSDLNMANMPMLELVAKSEMAERKGVGIPVFWTIHYFAFIYVSTLDPGNLAETQLNNLLDSVEAALKPSPATGKQTLGGVVFDCRINGPIERDPGFTSGIGAVAIPIEITTTS